MGMSHPAADQLSQSQLPRDVAPEKFDFCCDQAHERSGQKGLSIQARLTAKHAPPLCHRDPSLGLSWSSSGQCQDSPQCCGNGNGNVPEPSHDPKPSHVPSTKEGNAALHPLLGAGGQSSAGGGLMPG